jgi:hypothetical protein
MFCNLEEEWESTNWLSFWEDIYECKLTGIYEIILDCLTSAFLADN